MGHGNYSSYNRNLRSTTLGYQTKSIDQIFTQRNIHKDLNPFKVNLRESRDSDEHPNSVAVIIALDVTGSMGMVPHKLVKDGLPTIMETIMKAGIPDNQVMFMAIGDHKCDSSPLQIGQFESSDELIDKWLTSIYIEGNGGGNGGESYHLAWYFAGHRTSIDCFEKRKQKGFLFTVGDEPVHKQLPKDFLNSLFESGEFKDYTAEELLIKASEQYNVYHLHIKETYNGHSQHVMDGWKELIGENLIIVEDHTKIPQVIAETITNNVSKSNIIAEKEDKIIVNKKEDSNNDKEEIIL